MAKKRDIKLALCFGAMALVQLLLLILKQNGSINWAWGVVLIPAWIALALSAVALGIIVGCLIYTAVKKK